MVSAIILNERTCDVVSVIRNNAPSVCRASRNRLRSVVQRYFGARRSEVNRLTTAELFDLVPEDDRVW